MYQIVLSICQQMLLRWMIENAAEQNGGGFDLLWWLRR